MQPGQVAFDANGANRYVQPVMILVAGWRSAHRLSGKRRDVAGGEALV